VPHAAQVSCFVSGTTSYRLIAWQCEQVLNKWLKEENPKINEETYNFFRGQLAFPPRAVRGEGLRVGIQMIAQRLGRGTTDINLEQFLDESLLDELEKEGFYNLITK